MKFGIKTKTKYLREFTKMVPTSSDFHGSFVINDYWFVQARVCITETVTLEKKTDKYIESNFNGWISFWGNDDDFVIK